MGAQFYPADADGRPLIRCVCEALELAPMSCPACQLTLDINERNWRDLLRYLEMPVEPMGKIEGPRLAAICRAKLAAVDVQAIITGERFPPALAIEPTETVGARGAWCWTGGREPSYLHDRTRDLLKIALSAGKSWVRWS